MLMDYLKSILNGYISPFLRKKYGLSQSEELILKIKLILHKNTYNSIKLCTTLKKNLSKDTQDLGTENYKT